MRLGLSPASCSTAMTDTANDASIDQRRQAAGDALGQPSSQRRVDEEAGERE